MSLQAPQPDSVPTPSLHSLDRRAENRLQVCVPVRVTYVSGDRTSLEGTCTNVSGTGAAFDIDAVLQVGDVIDFEFCNTNDVPVTYRARVLYRSGTHYGTYFLMAY
jgi:PilZ domain